MKLPCLLALGFLLWPFPPAVGAPLPDAPFPKPDPEKAFAEFKVYGPDGSALRQPREDWTGARRRTQTEPTWREWLAARRSEVDDWMTHQTEHLEWVTGYWHDFVSPKDSSFLTWTPEEPGEETLHSPSDPRVRLTPKLHGAWVYGFRTRHSSKMEEAARLYRLTDETRYAAWAAGQLDFYATNRAVWAARPRQRGACIMWQSLDEAVNLIRYVQTARLLDGYASAQRREVWSAQLFKPEADLLEETMRRIHNIACWHRAAIGQVALYTQDPALWGKALDGPCGLRRQIALGVTSDYLWFEQSLGYNSYVVSALLPFFKAAALAGRLDEVRPEMAAVENLMLAPTSLRFPTGQLPTPADSTGGPGRAPNVGFWASACSVFPTAQGLALAARQQNWETLLDPPVPPAVVPPLPPVRSRNLESSRLAILKEGPWQVFFHYGQLDASHAQAEALNFEVFHLNTDLSHDPGTVGYGSPMHRDYYTKGLCHNVPLVDGAGQERWQRGELISFDPAAGRVTARQPDYRRGAAVTRELVLTAERFVDTVTLETKGAAAQPRKLGLALHLQGRVRLPPAFQPDPVFAATNRPAAFGYWRQPQTASYRDQATFEVQCGDRRFQVTLETPGPFTLTHASTPDVPPRRREGLYLETTGTKAVFKTVIQAR